MRISPFPVLRERQDCGRLGTQLDTGDESEDVEMVELAPLLVVVTIVVVVLLLLLLLLLGMDTVVVVDDEVVEQRALLSTQSTTLWPVVSIVMLFILRHKVMAAKR